MRASALLLNAHYSIFSLWLAVLGGAAPVDAAPNPSPLLGSNWGNPRRYIHLQTSTDVNTFYLEITFNGHVRKTTNRGSYSVVLLKAESRDHIGILGVKSNRFLCMDAAGNLFTSVTCRDDCLFHHKLLENHRDVYYSTKTGILLNLEGAKQVYLPGQNLPQSSLFLSERNTVPLERLQHRERRNRQVDPSDPLNALGPGEASDSRGVLEEDADLDLEPSEGGRNISRETLVSPSDDDPWELLHAMNPSSPRITGVVG